MPFVMDASIAACWALADETDTIASSAFQRISTDGAIVPAHWWFEIRNALLMNERRQRITESDTSAFCRVLTRLRIIVDQSPGEQDLLHLSHRHRLTVYDAAYLELARRTNVPLASLDQKLVRAAQAENVSVLPAP